jgi:hypothetical protein
LPFLNEAVNGNNAVIKMRVFDLTVRIAKSGPEMTERYINLFFSEFV